MQETQEKNLFLNFLFSPIEQFELISFICKGISNLTIFFIIIFIVIFFYLYFKVKFLFTVKFKKLNKNIAIFYLSNKFKYVKNYIFIIKFIPTYIQYMIETYVLEFIIFYKNIVINFNTFNFFNIIFTSIIFIFIANMIGLIPYSYTLTAQIFMTFNVACLMFFSFNFTGFNKHTYELINIIIPSGLNIFLNFLLIPIEMISYIFRPISLSIRLFANIMAGHTLLKVICTFISSFVRFNLSFTMIMLPILCIGCLFGLETFVALIQSYVFLILICIFLKDILILAH